MTYEVVDLLSRNGLGQSTGIGIGGDPIRGLNFVDCLKLFEQDPETEAIVIIGEIGGNAEEKAAEFVKKGVITKPVVAHVVGVSAPGKRRMGHAAAIIEGGKGTAQGKIAVFEGAGVKVARTVGEIPQLVNSLYL